MRTNTAARIAAGTLSLLVALEQGPVGEAAAQPRNAEPTVAELLDRIEALEQALAEMRKQSAATAASAPCEPAEESGPRASGAIAVKRSPDGGPPVPASVGTGAPARGDAAQEIPSAEASAVRPAVEARTSKPTAGYKDGFFLASSDGAYKLKLGGYIQADSRFFADQGSTSDLDNQFRIRRARLDLRGTIADRFKFQLMPDFAGDNVSLEDAIIDVEFAPWLELRAGKFKTPFGTERLQSSKNIPFVERALTNNLVPGRDLGVRLAGQVWDEKLDYALAVLNGVPDGDDGDGDVNDGVDVVGYVYVRPFSTNMYSVARGLGFGVAATYGREQGSSSDEQLPSYRTSGRATFFSYTEEGDDAVADGDHYRVTPSATWYEGSFGLLTEYVLSAQQISRDEERGWVDNDAWQIRTSYMLTGENATMKGVEPNAPFDFGGGAWGAWEAALRWSSLDVDGDAFRKGFADPAESARHADALGMAINWYLNRNVSFYLDYELTMFGGGDGTGDRDDEHVFLTRLQLQF